MPMHADRFTLVERLHATEGRCVLVVTGGGAGACADLLAVPGASRTVLEVLVPYANSALTDFLGHTPEQFCSAATAADIAAHALTRARRLHPEGGPLAGVGCTAALASDRPKRGDHRFFLAVHTAATRSECSLTLAKGARDRAGEEAILGAVLLNALAETFGVAGPLPVPYVDGEHLTVAHTPNGLFGRFLAGEIDALCQESDGRLRVGPPWPSAVLPGSFNPLHAGHLGMAAAAGRQLGLPVAFELSVRNVDKPDLAGEEVFRRVRQFEGRAAVWLTRAPTFDRKSELFPGAVFVVGADTASRIVDARYWGGTPEGLTTALGCIAGRGCRFVVAGRADAAGAFVGLSSVAVPETHRSLFAEIPESEFRLDLSSTQLRAERARVG